MSLFIFARFHAKPAAEHELLQALLSILQPTRGEPGCCFIHLFQSVRDPALFFIHSEWKTTQDFDAHGNFPHMQAFLAHIPDLIDHSLDVTRAEKLD